MVHGTLAIFLGTTFFCQDTNLEFSAPLWFIILWNLTKRKRNMFLFGRSNIFCIERIKCISTFLCFGTWECCHLHVDCLDVIVINVAIFIVIYYFLYWKHQIISIEYFFVFWSTLGITSISSMQIHMRIFTKINFPFLL